MVEFRVDRSAGLPAYLQLVRQVREALRMGWLVPGDRLPTVRAVVASSGVNPNTVLKAYRELEVAGLVEARQGSGTYVRRSLNTVEADTMTGLRAGLAEWVRGARDEGLANDDIEALLGAVLFEDQGEVGR
ncbi:GntR family transcriptional regulator [Amycolatopsis antarctica]|uniref:GntR family transcriptional regulator n=1 Tax=Amycolatopsis antarctica TaxID=1854586 RepID=A0A263CXR9_9PSEU|nr:GntR family transcriptional regulator [Amycolatopsis antarctica]OZM70217.1 GntR family transcriptional regulator [Amycolatopsis antarctica]